MWIVTFLKRVILALGLGGDDGDRRELRALLRNIDRRGPRWYRPWSNRIDGSFAESVAALREALAPLGTVLKATIAGDKDAERGAVDALLGRALADSGLSLGSLSFEEVKAEAERRGGPSARRWTRSSTIGSASSRPRPSSATRSASGS